MTIQTPDLTAVVERLETVERQNRRMKRVGLIAIGLVGAVFVMGQAEPKSRVVEAEQFIVRDSRGQKRALLGLEPSDLTRPQPRSHRPVQRGPIQCRDVPVGRFRGPVCYGRRTRGDRKARHPAVRQSQGGHGTEGRHVGNDNGCRVGLWTQGAEPASS